MSDLVIHDGQAPWIEDVDLDGCVVVGPAVLLMTDSVTFDSNAMDAKMFWPLDDLGRGYIGAIGLRRARFHGCSFRDIGIAADRATIDRFFG